MTHPFTDRRPACLSDFQTALHTRGAVVAVAAHVDHTGNVDDYEVSVQMDDVRRTMVEPPRKERRRGR